MNNTKTTKRALLTSAFSMIICVAMLIGTTFAWFTDSASTAVNKIQAGTLDVQLLMYDGSNYVDISDNTRAIFGSGSLAQNNNAQTLWEPGKTQVAYLAIKNNGNLALKYKVALDVTNVNNNLYEVMEYAITPDATNTNPVTDWTSGSSVNVGTQFVANDVSLAVGATHYFALSVHMKEEAGNDYQGGMVNFDLTVLATQYTSEADSFDDQYDKDAEYDDPRLWDGETADTEWYTDELKTQIAEATAEDPVNIEIASANQFAGVVELSKTETNFKNTVFTLESDIDLDGHFMEQIGARSKIGFFQGTFDGNGHTIYNYKQNDDNVDYSNLGLFGVLNGATVKNLTIDGADISDSHYGGVGIIAGCTTSEGAMAGVPVTVENVHIKNSIVRRTDPTEGGYQVNKIGLFFGNVNGKADVIIKDCSIENCVAVNSAEILPVSPWYGRNEKTSGWAPTIENSTATNVIVGSVYDTGYNAADIALQDILSGAVKLKTE